MTLVFAALAMVFLALCMFSEKRNPVLWRAACFFAVLEVISWRFGS